MGGRDVCTFDQLLIATSDRQLRTERAGVDQCGDWDCAIALGLNQDIHSKPIYYAQTRTCEPRAKSHVRMRKNALFANPSFSDVEVMSACLESNACSRACKSIGQKNCIEKISPTFDLHS